MSSDTKGLKHRETVDNYTKWMWSMFEEDVGDEVVEIGCGRAPFAPYFASRCSQYYGIDQSRDVLSDAREKYQSAPNITFRRMNIEDESIIEFLKTTTFDTIVCLNVLEHIKDDERVLKLLADNLASNDRLILQVPAHPWLHGTNDDALGHYRRYSLGEFTEKLDKSGLTPLRNRYFNFSGIVPWFIEGKILRQKEGHFEGGSEKELSLENFIVPFLWTLEDLIPPPMGISIFCTARAERQ